MKLKIEFEIDLTALIETWADDMNMSDEDVTKIVADPAFKKYVTEMYESNEDIWPHIDEYIEESIDDRLGINNEV